MRFTIGAPVANYLVQLRHASTLRTPETRTLINSTHPWAWGFGKKKKKKKKNIINQSNVCDPLCKRSQGASLHSRDSSCSTNQSSTGRAFSLIFGNFLFPYPSCSHLPILYMLLILITSLICLYVSYSMH